MYALRNCTQHTRIYFMYLLILSYLFYNNSQFSSFIFSLLFHTIFYSAPHTLCHREIAIKVARHVYVYLCRVRASSSAAAVDQMADKQQEQGQEQGRSSSSAPTLWQWIHFISLALWYHYWWAHTHTHIAIKLAKVFMAQYAHRMWANWAGRGEPAGLNLGSKWGVFWPTCR